MQKRERNWREMKSFGSVVLVQNGRELLEVFHQLLQIEQEEIHSKHTFHSALIHGVVVCSKPFQNGRVLSLVQGVQGLIQQLIVVMVIVNLTAAIAIAV